jgi:16S rRNA (guanine966-N2)-methyltransferase
MAAEARGFDLILLDPPYRSGTLPEILREVVGSGILRAGGLVVAEAESGLEAPSGEGLERIDERRYGGTRLFFWTRRPPP